MNQCQALVQFDTLQTSSNLLDIITMSSYVNEKNYDTVKTQSSAKVPGYFSGSYDDFREKINLLEQRFQLAGYTNVQNNYYHRIMSPTGAKVYAECIRQTSNKQMSAWVETINETKLTIGVRNGLAGNSKVKYRVVGEKPLNKPSLLLSNTEEHLMFEYSSNRDFTIILTSIDKVSNATDSVSISIPKIRKFELRTEESKLNTQIEMGAGCQGNSSGCAYSREGVFVADKDFELIPSTLQKIGDQVIGGPGISHCTIEWHEDKIGSQVKRMTGFAHNIDGNNGDTQGSNRYLYQINQRREYIVEVL